MLVQIAPSRSAGEAAADFLQATDAETPSEKNLAVQQSSRAPWESIRE